MPMVAADAVVTSETGAAEATEENAAQNTKAVVTSATDETVAVQTTADNSTVVAQQSVSQNVITFSRTVYVIDPMDMYGVATYAADTQPGKYTVDLGTPVWIDETKKHFQFTNAKVDTQGDMISLMIVTLSTGTLPESIREGAYTDNFNRSATWIFVNGKTGEEIEQKLHEMVFDYVDDMNVYCSINANENIGFDDTENVRLTQWSQNGHYYLYVPEYISWTNAYLRAQTYKLAGQEGYLATIGSLEEARYLINLNNNQSLWIGGTRLLLTNDDKRLQNTKLKTVAKGVLKYGYTYYWAGGPEAGSDINKNIGLSGASFDMQAQCFGCLNNTLYDIQGYESCM